MIIMIVQTMVHVKYHIVFLLDICISGCIIRGGILEMKMGTIETQMASAGQIIDGVTPPDELQAHYDICLGSVSQIYPENTGFDINDPDCLDIFVGIASSLRSGDSTTAEDRIRELAANGRNPERIVRSLSIVCSRLVRQQYEIQKAAEELLTLLSTNPSQSVLVTCADTGPDKSPPFIEVVAAVN